MRHKTENKHYTKLNQRIVFRAMSFEWNNNFTECRKIVMTAVTVAARKKQLGKKRKNRILKGEKKCSQANQCKLY